MKPIMQSIRDITDSSEVYDSRPNPFFAVIIYAIIALLAAALTWAYFGEIEEYIRANGSVRPAGSVSTVKNTLTGRIDQLYIYEGMKVETGSVLYTIENDALLLSQKELTDNLQKLLDENGYLTRLRESAVAGENLFDAGDLNEAAYYNRFQKYLSDTKANTELGGNSETDISKRIADAEASINSYTVTLNDARALLNNLETVMDSVAAGESRFTDAYSEYGRRYEDYALNMKRLYAAYTDAADKYDRLNRLYAAGGASQSETEAALRQTEMAKLDYDRYDNEFTMNIQEAIRQTQADIKEYSDRVKQLQSDAQSYRDKAAGITIMREKAQNDMLVQIEDELTQNVRETDRIENELANLTLELEKSVVKAAANGIVNLYTEISPGDLLQSGAEIATITPETAEEFRIQMTVPNKDIAGVTEGQEIKYHFTALPYQDYGELTGRVELIGTDSRVNGETGESYYYVEASVKSRELINRNGEAARIKTGMTCEAQIVTKSKKILNWLLEKIELIN